MRRRLRIIGLISFLLVSVLAEAQLVFQPIKSSNAKKSIKSKADRTTSNTITIPIWEDFSDYTTNQPDTKIWEDSENVFISSGHGVNPPSLNVATFDGIKADGSPYSQIATAQGRTDTLTTCPIDLSSFTLADDITLYFFYQFAGFGESPDDADSLRVEFLDPTGEWVPVWPLGEPLDRSGEFVQVVLPITEADFLHDAFRFRFQSFGRQSGPFDVWNVDYIFFNEARKPNDRDYPDRAISTPLGPIFPNQYFSIPRTHFNDSLIRASLVLSENDIDDFGEDFSLDIEIQVVDYLDSAISTQNTFTSTNFSPPEGNFLPAGAVETFSLPELVPSSVFNNTADSTFLNSIIILNSDDDDDLEENSGGPKVNFPTSNFLRNDTTRSTYVLKDYYAYDDGSAEIGVGVNDDGSRLAYEFIKYGDTLNFITAIDIYFPFVNTSPNGKSINLTVWDQSSDEEPDNVLYEETLTINASIGLNTFTRFELSTPIEVEDSVFYIGYRQNTFGDLSVGFDRNNDTNDKIFFNLLGFWEQDPTIQGSLMMRPVFGAAGDSVITSIPKIPEMQNIRIYPNPVSDRLNVVGRNQKIEILSMDGKSMYRSEGVEEEVIIEMSSFPKGLYLLRVFSGNQVVNRKIIKQ